MNRIARISRITRKWPKTAGLLWLLFPLAGMAAEEIPQMSMEDCVASALVRNSRVKEAGLEMGIASQGVREAQGAYLPTVDASVQYNRWNEGQYLRFPMGGVVQAVKIVGPDRIAARLTGNQTLIDFGRASNGVDAARFDERAKETSLGGIRFRIANGTKTLFSRAMYYRMEDSLYRDNVARNALRVEIAMKRLEAGTGTKSDVLRAQVAASDAAAMASSSAKEYRKSLDDLAEIMGAEPGRFALRGGLATGFRAVDLEKDADFAYRTALEHRADLKELAFGKLRSDALVRAAKSELWPRLSAQAEFLYDGPNSQDEYYNADDRGLKTDSWRVGLNLQGNLYAGGATSARIRKERLRREAAEERETGLKRSVLAEIRGALNDMQVAQVLMRSSEVSREQAKENLRAIQVKYEGGATTTLDYQDAINSLVLAEISSLQRKWDLVEAGLRIERTMGTTADFLTQATPHKE